MTRYIYGDELYHFGRSKADGAPGPGTGNWRRPHKISFYKYDDGSLTPEGVKWFRRFDKKYAKALKKYNRANSNPELVQYRTFKINPNNVKYDYAKISELADSPQVKWIKSEIKNGSSVSDLAEKLKVSEETIKNAIADKKGSERKMYSYGERKDYIAEKPKSVISGHTSKGAYQYNMQYIKPLSKLLDARDKKKEIEKEIEKWTGKSPVDAKVSYDKKSSISPQYARTLLIDLSSRYMQYHIPTNKSKISAYKKGVKDLEKLFPESMVTINEEYVEFLKHLKEE